MVDLKAKEKTMPVSTVAALVVALVTSLGGNGYLGVKAANTGDQLELARDKVAALEKRFEDHVATERLTMQAVNTGLGAIRTEISGVKDTLIDIVSKLRE